MTAAAPRVSDQGQPFPESTLTPADVRRHMDGVAAFLGGAANVIMQLSHPPVGYGVLESTVDSGKVTLHPLKRLRTTLTYLAVAWMGTEEDRRVYREAVNGSHRPVRSGPDSPVEYNAFDPKLQLWVAACLYWGVDDLYTRMRGPMESELAEEFYRYSARLGTTLQMKPEMWPADRAAFFRYWEENLAQRTIDEPVRRYFNDLIDLKMTPRPVRLVFGRFHRFTVTALLPQHLRDQMGMTWTDRDERRFTTLLRAISTVWTRLPPVIRAAPLNTYLADMRLRRRLGLNLV
ncbi:oxygenase MpaB family protein [Nocardia sp. BMG51109]|uniref:oxygenase MpaB family protein n=1 Tax=Nocardia sp. BMG51109 TaxID=1056816 RepID=UPI000466B449|nr:oxygenase MpaB family protein [Nocardia sp. BMG51109]